MDLELITYISHFSQFFILTFGAIGIWLLASKNEKHQKIACLVGLAGQPFYLYATYTTDGQWGMFALSLICTISWLKGVFVFWVLPAYLKRVAKT